MIAMIDLVEDYCILGYEALSGVSLPLRNMIFSCLPILSLSSIGKMMLAVVRFDDRL